MRLRRVDVLWTDATDAGGGWMSIKEATQDAHDEHRKSLCSTVGHLLHEDEDKIVIVQSHMINMDPEGDGDMVRQAFVIPRGWIKEIQEWPHGTEETTGNVQGNS